MDMKLEKRKGQQQGAALIMVLGLLAFGGAVIPTTLSYVTTGLKTAEIPHEYLPKQYAADAAIEYSLWLIAYNVDGVIDGLTLEAPSSSTTVTVNDIEVPTTIEIALSAEGGEPGPLPATETGIYLEAVLQVNPEWAPAGQYTDFDFIVHARNYGTASVHLKGVLQILPIDFEYIPGSYAGPDAVFTETWVTDHWELNWDFTSPLPNVDSEQSFPVPFSVRGYLPTGMYTDFGTGFVFYSAFGEEQTLQAGSLLDAYAIGLYDISVTADGYTIEANAGIYETETGLNSYQSE